MEGANMPITSSFFHGLFPSNSSKDHSLNQQAAILDQSAVICGRPLHSSRGKDLQNLERMDPKMLKRVMASRNYSKKYRMKQMEYIMHLETEVKALQAEVTINTPRIKYAERQNALLRVENGSIKHKLSSYNAELLFKEAQYEELKREREMLRQICSINHHQTQIRREKMTMMNEAPSFLPSGIGGWNQPMCSAVVEPNSFGIFEQPLMIE